MNYSIFQIFAGPYRITPSSYKFMYDWVETTEGGALPEEAVDAYLALPISVRDVMHTEMIASLEMARDNLIRQLAIIVRDLEDEQSDVPFSGPT